MANFFKFIHSGTHSTIVNCDNIQSITLQDKVLTIYFKGKDITVTYGSTEDAKKAFGKLFARSDENLNYGNEDLDNDDDDDAEDNYEKPNNELILTQRIDELLDLINKKNEEIKRLTANQSLIQKIKKLI